jgi:hypothetical protein
VNAWVEALFESALRQRVLRAGLPDG